MELLDVYNDEAKRTGRVVVRGDKSTIFAKDEHIAVAIIYIENSKGEFLIQKTTAAKGNNYTSTGGHVDHGEEPEESIKREVYEELGIDISKENVISLGYELFDFPVRFLFYLKKDIDLKTLKLQKEEVASVSYMSVKKLKNIIAKGQMNKGHAMLLEKVLAYKESLHK